MTHFQFKFPILILAKAKVLSTPAKRRARASKVSLEILDLILWQGGKFAEMSCSKFVE